MDSTRGEQYEYQPELDAYLRALDRVIPDAVEGVYLTGSAALGDYHHGQSDLDLLTLTTHPLTESEMAALEAAHMELEQGTQPHLDAVYIPREFIGKLPPREARGHAYVVDGEFKRGHDSQDLVIWAILDQCGITLRGPEAKSLDAAPDRAEFAAWNLGNLEDYWRAQAQAARQVLGERDVDAQLPTYSAVWFGTGPGRLHRTIATGEIISKSRSAEYSAELFPAYRELLARVRASRMGDESVAFTTRDGLALCDLVDEICDSAEKLAQRSGQAIGAPQGRAAQPPRDVASRTLSSGNAGRAQSEISSCSTATSHCEPSGAVAPADRHEV